MLMGLSIRLLLSILILTLLSGCQFIRIDRAVFTPSSPLIYRQSDEFVFTPDGKETFVLKEKPETLQTLGYDRFCANTYRKVCRNKLPYIRYVGLRGYFDSEKPVKSDGESYEYYPVILENGEKYFFLSTKKDGGKYGSTSPITAVSFNSNFVVQPFIQGSEINIVGEYTNFDTTYYLLSNEKVLENSQLKYIRDISQRYSQRSKIADLLLRTAIEYNQDYDSYLIQPNAFENSSDVRLILGVNKNSSWLRFKVSHLSDSKKLITGFTVIADNKQWHSPKLQFEVLNQTKKVHEFFEIRANQQELNIVLALAKSSKAILKLHAENELIDRELQNTEKQQLLDMLKLSQLLSVRKT